MLETLKIKNIAIIDSAEIPFKKGLNIISGETGAGKSIVIEAISLLLGGRASTDLIRSGVDEATVEGLFDISEITWLKPRLEKLGLDATDDSLLIKRVVSRNGRHRIFINGGLATLSILQELSVGLIDLCGQHEHQSLLRAPVQMDLLDRYGALEKQTQAFAEFFHEWQSVEKERLEIQAAEAERSKRADFLKFQIDELTAAALEEGEDEKLALEKQLLQSAESRLKAAESAQQTLESEREGVLDLLRTASIRIKNLIQLDESTAPMKEGLDRAIAEAEEVSLTLNRYLGSVDLNQDRLETVQERLGTIADFRRKYGATVHEMIESQGKLEAEYSLIGNTENRLKELEKNSETAKSEVLKAGKKLSQLRKKASEIFSDSVSGELKDLKLEGAKFSIDLSVSDELSDWNATGADQIQFVVRTNQGEPARPLGKIASGGELSRLMLAIRRVIADKGGIGVYLFDEIDAGIGGQTAFQVGKKLKSVAKHNQVICITHLPQVASFADHHLIVSKSSSGKRTVTEIVVLESKKHRQEELARMLGGAQLTKKSLENAAELLELAR